MSGRAGGTTGPVLKHPDAITPAANAHRDGPHSMGAKTTGTARPELRAGEQALEDRLAEGEACLRDLADHLPVDACLVRRERCPVVVRGCAGVSQR